MNADSIIWIFRSMKRPLPSSFRITKQKPRGSFFSTRENSRELLQRLILLALEVIVTKGGFIKIKLGLGKLYKKVEKKQILKEKDIKKQMDREVSAYHY